MATTGSLLVCQSETETLKTPTRHFRRCDSCDSRFHPDDLNTVNVEEYGQHNTLEICDDCMAQPNASKLSIKAFDFISRKKEIDK